MTNANSRCCWGKHEVEFSPATFSLPAHEWPATLAALTVITQADDLPKGAAIEWRQRPKLKKTVSLRVSACRYGKHEVDM